MRLRLLQVEIHGTKKWENGLTLILLLLILILVLLNDHIETRATHLPRMSLDLGSKEAGVDRVPALSSGAGERTDG